MSSSEERQWGMSVKIGLFKWCNLRWHIKKMIIKYFHSFLHEILHSPGLMSEGLTIELLRNGKKRWELRMKRKNIKNAWHLKIKNKFQISKCLLFRRVLFNWLSKCYFWSLCLLHKQKAFIFWFDVMKDLTEVGGKKSKVKIKK